MNHYMHKSIPYTKFEFIINFFLFLEIKRENRLSLLRRVQVIIIRIFTPGK